MWQCIAQSPGSSATNSIVRVLPTGNQHGGLGHWPTPRNLASVGGGDHEVEAVEMNRVMIHGPRFPKSDANSVAGLDDQRSVARKRLAVEGEHVEVAVISTGFGRTMHQLRRPTRSAS